MGYVKHFDRKEDGSKKEKLIPDSIMFEELEERVDDINVEVPYFQQAFQVVLFSPTNSRAYPRTRDDLAEQDQVFQDSGAYIGLTEGQKAQLLIDAVFE